MKIFYGVNLVHEKTELENLMLMRQKNNVERKNSQKKKNKNFVSSSLHYLVILAQMRIFKHNSPAILVTLSVS